jgi:hypothetical protein
VGSTALSWGMAERTCAGADDRRFNHHEFENTRNFRKQS